MSLTTDWASLFWRKAGILSVLNLTIENRQGEQGEQLAEAWANIANTITAQIEDYFQHLKATPS